MAIQQLGTPLSVEQFFSQITGSDGFNFQPLNMIAMNIETAQNLPRLKETFKNSQGVIRTLSTCWVPDFRVYESCEFVMDPNGGESTHVIKQYPPITQKEKETPAGMPWARAYQGHCSITKDWINQGYWKI